MNEGRPEEKDRAAGDILKATGDHERSVAIVDHRIDSRDLFVATREIIIGHGDEHYRLRLTAQNKLILTK